jgi:hypothetical protein
LKLLVIKSSLGPDCPKKRKKGKSQRKKKRKEKLEGEINARGKVESYRTLEE